jgi:hypothetical protein
LVLLQPLEGKDRVKYDSTEEYLCEVLSQSMVDREPIIVPIQTDRQDLRQSLLHQIPI